MPVGTGVDRGLALDVTIQKTTLLQCHLPTVYYTQVKTTVGLLPCNIYGGLLGQDMQNASTAQPELPSLSHRPLH